MLNATRPPPRPIPPTSPTTDISMSSPSTSFRYSATRPRFSTNPSSQNRSASKEPTVMTHSTHGLPTTTEESGPGWTGGQYPGPPLPARNGNGNGSGGTGVPTDTSLSNSESSGQNGSGNNSNAAQNGHATTTTTGVSTVPFPAPEEITPVEPTIIRSGKKDRRPLPPRPHPPVLEQIPAWEPDVKAHIPPNVTLDSRQAAYAQMGNPPPMLRSAIVARQDPTRDRAGMLRRPAVNGVIVLRESPRAVGKVDKKGKGRSGEETGGVAGEYVLDPSLPSSLPEDAVSLSRDLALTAGGTKRKHGSIDGERPTAIFKTIAGDIDLRLSVVNEESMREDDLMLGGSSVQTRRAKKARVEVNSARGHIRVDLVKMDKHRQLSMDISSKAGNIFLQLPETFRGRIQCSTSATQPTILLPIMRQRAKILATHKGETTCYLGTPPTKETKEPPLLPPRRFSNRLRERSSGSSLVMQSLPEDGNTMYDSPPAMEVDGFRLPSPSQMANTSSSTFIPTLQSSPKPKRAVPASPLSNGNQFRQEDQREEDEYPESTLFLSSYMGAITLGIYGHEPPATFKGATTLSGLVQGLGEMRGEMKRKVKEKVGL